MHVKNIRSHYAVNLSNDKTEARRACCL